MLIHQRPPLKRWKVVVRGLNTRHSCCPDLLIIRVLQLVVDRLVMEAEIQDAEKLARWKETQI
ncbi:hypothetical protein NC653_011091 [Populus alba x Populus x berolinensis]|uniref:Uncharacterized protein n=1 Tax=Populus alba x Populus x berolinensis TaxID=444605 RepID=A0AAD6R1H0_9ROSI|nr:hypothetical protein NC653_011091 [Populus alba x Populus x berolinensis]